MPRPHTPAFTNPPKSSWFSSNVLFVGSRMFEIQRLIATKPDIPQKA